MVQWESSQTTTNHRGQMYSINLVNNGEVTRYQRVMDGKWDVFGKSELRVTFFRKRLFQKGFGCNIKLLGFIVWL